MKIGVGVVTCNRINFLEKLIESLQQCSDIISDTVIINDGKPISETSLIFQENLINNDTNIGVGKSKNKALRLLLDKGCDYIFLIEDDMIITNRNVFEEYIAAIKETGIQHFMFGYHGPANKNNISGGVPVPRAVIQYPSGRKIALNTHCVGSFCVYTRESLLKVGLIDETYVNTWEHISHSLDLVNAGYAPGYWWWPDLANSTDYIREQACSEDSSSIRGTSEWRPNMIKGANHFKSKHGYSPVEVPSLSLDEIKSKLKLLVK